MITEMNMRPLLYCTTFASLLLTGAVFGFFYAFYCSVMWGLDASPPDAAIAAMQGINREVRNAAFFPAFFLPPVFLAAGAILSWTLKNRSGGLAFGLAALVYLGGGLILTMAVNVPMNEAFALVSIPANEAEAQLIWNAYSQPWQFWNAVRTGFSGAALLLIGWGLLALGQQNDG